MAGGQVLVNRYLIDMATKLPNLKKVVFLSLHCLVFDEDFPPPWVSVEDEYPTFMKILTRN